jgi:hypothetical protein
MLETAASRGWKAKDAIEWFHGIDRLVMKIRRTHLFWLEPSFISQSPIEFIGHVIDFVPDITSPSEKRYPILPLHYASQASSLSTTLTGLLT